MPILRQTQPEIPVLSSLAKFMIVSTIPNRRRTEDGGVGDIIFLKSIRSVVILDCEGEKTHGIVVGQAKMYSVDFGDVLSSEFDPKETREIPLRITFQHPDRLLQRRELEEIVVVEG